MLLFLLFFFLCDGDHRDLHVLTHSFPTRRSSDLLRPGSAQQPPPHRAATGAAIMSRSGAVKQSPPTTGRLHEAFGPLFRRCHLRSQQAFARVFDGYGLSPLQYGILELVLLNHGLGHGALAEAMATAPPVVTTAMKTLRAAGHVV